MLLIQRSLRGRAFALQFQQIMSEFGDTIPWLSPVQPIVFATNAAAFERMLLDGLGCANSDELSAFQFVESIRSRCFVGGIVHLARAPERFATDENAAIMTRLTRDGYGFISCLQIRDVFRGQGNGRELFRRALGSVLERYGRVWGVVSEPRVLQWHLSLGLGARLHTSTDNEERLWILSWG